MTYPSQESVREMVFLRRDHVAHPRIGMGIAMPREDHRRPSANAFDAWLWLNTYSQTRQNVPGDGGQPITVDLVSDAAFLPNLAQEWNWPTKVVRRWMCDLAADGLVTGRLLAATTKFMPAARRYRDRIPSPLRAAVMAKTSGKCVYCGVVLTTVAGHPNSYQADHVLSVADGGTDDIANLVPSCRSCNAKKGAKTALVFLGGGHAP